jgi:ABC-type sugar transport system substrate-binding protein
MSFVRSFTNLSKIGVAAILATVALHPATASAKDLTIAFTGYSTDSPFWVGVAAAAKAEAGAEGVQFVDLTTATADAAGQKDAVDRAIGSKVDGILLGAVDNRGWDDTLAKAKAAGIPVLAVDTPIDNSWIKSVIATDNLKAAGLAGKYIVDHAKKGTVLILGGTKGHKNGDARRDGVTKAAEAAGFKVIFQICDWKEDCGNETTTNMTASNPDITAIFAASDGMALAAVAALKENGKLKNMVTIGFDGNPANLKSIAAGELTGDVKQDNTRMGKKA